MGIAIYNWEQIKNDYFNSETEQSNTYLKQRFGKGVEEDGNFANRTTGWTQEKAKWKLERIKKNQSIIDKELMEKMKIPIIKILENKRTLFNLDSAYLKIYDKKNSGQEITKSEAEFFQMYKETGMIKGIYERMQNELGLVSDRKGIENIDSGDWDDKMDSQYEEFILWRKAKL